MSRPNHQSRGKRIVLRGYMACLFLAMVTYAVSPNHKSAQAQETADLEEMVVTSTLTERLITESPGSVEVIAYEDFREMGATTVSEALEEATGMIVSSEPGRVRTPSIRGARTKHTLVLIDGRRQAAGFRDVVDINQIPLVAVERIEVLRGPGSALYGSDALGGVVNIVTQQAPASPVAGALGQYGIDSYGERNTYIGNVYAGAPLHDRFSFLLSGQLKDRDGWGEDRMETREVVGGDETEQGAASGRFAFDLAPGHVLSSGFEYNDFERSGLRFHTGQIRDRQSEDQRLNYYLTYDAEITPTDQLMLRLNRSSWENTIELSPPSSEDGASSRENTLSQIESRYSGACMDKHLVTIGLEYREEESKASDERDHDIDNLSAFIQDEYQLFAPWLFVGSVRVDRHSEFGSQITPRASIIYNLNENLRLKATYGTGFRAPSISELFEETPRKRGKVIYEPNSDLDPEESQSVELGIEGQFQALRFNITAFRNEVEDMIDAAFDRTEGTGPGKIEYYQWRNISEARMQGVETVSALDLPLRFSLQGTLTWLDTKDEETGQEIEGQPEYKSSLKLSYTYPAWDLSCNIRMNYTGRRFYETGDEGGYTLYNAYLSKGLGKTCKFFLGADNIFDNHPNEVPPYYYAGLRMDF
ncbi:MAG: TonB-dependent receptor plug domain-containing protein [Desulfovermiculus sp.]